MKGNIAQLVFVIMFIACSVSAGEVVVRRIESEQPMIIDGNWIYPENGAYTVVMTDTNLTVNGYEYVHPEVVDSSMYREYTREENFIE
ncbi:MAG: hypothetical protein JSV33_09765 [bacterium]|nr:MAG: hypothetical protein JSV33_09765 [bacterium]